MVVSRKRKEAQPMSTTTFSIGNCKVEVPSNVDQEYSAEKACLHVFEQTASITITVEKLKNPAMECPSPCIPGRVSPTGPLFQLLNPKSLDEMGKQLLESAVQLYHQELPAMSFAANTGKESNFLKNCTTNGKYCTLLMTQPGATPTDNQIVVGAITYQILPPDTQFAEIPLAAVDQAHQRKGLGGSLFRELARRLADVGVLTLFCWGDHESELFWNKQGFLKIAEVDRKGKPQKLPLKAEIRKAMSLPGSATLMACNMRSSLPQLSSTITSVPAGYKTPEDKSKMTNTVFVSEGEVRTPSDSTHVGTRVTPVAGSKTSETSSPMITTPCQVPFSSNPNPDQATLAPSSRNSMKASTRLEASARGTGSKISVTDNPLPRSKPSTAKFSRTLRFAGVNECIEDEIENDDGGSPPGPDPAKHDDIPLAPGMGLKSASPSGVAVVTPGFARSRPALLIPAAGTPRATKAPLMLSELRKPLMDVTSRQPFKVVQNIAGNGIEGPAKSPVKKRPWEMTHCDYPMPAASTAPYPQATIVDAGPDKENSDAAIKETMEAEQEKSGSIKMFSRKRPRDEPSEVQVEGAKLVRKRQAADIGTSKPVSKKPEVLMSEPATTPEPVVDCDMVTSKPSLAELEEMMFEAAMAFEPALAAQSAPAVPLEPAANTDAVSGSRITEVLDCEQPMADEGLSRLEGSPSSRGDEQFNSRLEQQESDLTIRKRLAARPVHVPEVVKVSAQAPAGEVEDPVKAPPRHVVFLMNTTKNSKKATQSQTQLVEKLGGTVTGDGGQCTHVVTGEVRRTLNFCSALCNGAWVVTPDWLKASSRHKSFVDEKPYLLKDRQFELKYNVTVASAVEIARQKPSSLLAGFSVYPTPHLQPPINTVVQLTQAAGGKILSSLDEALKQGDPSHTIVLACEEDMEEGIRAAKAGLRTFNGEWFMQSIVKQTLDMSANLIEQL